MEIKQLTEKAKKFLTKRNIIIAFLIFVFLLIIFSASGKQKPLVWYVDEELRDKWAQVLAEILPSKKPAQIKVWDGLSFPAEASILISLKPWETEERVKVFSRLSWELEHEGAHALALDPWMIFNKNTNPSLTYNRVFTDTRGRGVLLIPGRDIKTVRAWTSRFIQEPPGSFPSDDVWVDWETRLFDIGLFSSSMRGYDWSAVFFRLMSNEQAWLYAPSSAVRAYRDPRKTILEASVFPEQGSREASMLTSILWARPIKSKSKKTSLLIDNTIDFLKKSETQTTIADKMEWIPADPYGTPYDPSSLTAHRAWLTTIWIYSIYN